MATYLIDYENVHQNGLDGIKKLGEGDTVIIFVGNKIDSVSVDTLMAIINSEAQVRIKKMRKTADNYLDFQLATCLGGLVASGAGATGSAGSEHSEYYIVSNDRDFESVIDYWKHNKPSAKIELRSAIAPAAKQAAATKDRGTKKNTAAADASGAAGGGAAGGGVAGGRATGSKVADSGGAGGGAAGSRENAPKKASSSITDSVKKRISKVLPRYSLAGGNYTKIYNIVVKHLSKDSFLASIKSSYPGDKYKQLANELLPAFEEQLKSKQEQ
ncbi:MAG: hypothetical protein LBG82_07630 [Clostridiales Family XIII bacterium]|jgi:hypothetical protein|nr:hypothetical protein [Clostridiales Family XIII bacterium]